MTTLALAKIDFSLPDVQVAAKNIIAKEASAADYQIFLHICMANRLNPFYGEIFLISTQQGPRPYVSLKGMLKIAERDYKAVYEGFEPFERWYQDAKGELNRDRRGKIHSVIARVHRSDRKFPMEFEALWSTYAKPGKDKPSNWDKYPDLMLTEKAMRGALVFAFPVPGAEEGDDVDERELKPPAVTQEVIAAIPAPKPELVKPTASSPAPVHAPAPAQAHSVSGNSYLEATKLRVDLHHLISEIRKNYLPNQTEDYLASRAFGKKDMKYHHIAAIESVDELQAAIDYCNEYIGKAEEKGGAK